LKSYEIRLGAVPTFVRLFGAIPTFVRIVHFWRGAIPTFVRPHEFVHKIGNYLAFRHRTKLILRPFALESPEERVRGVASQAWQSRGGVLFLHYYLSLVFIRYSI